MQKSPIEKNMAELIVANWESIPTELDKFCHKFGEHLRPHVEEMMRGIAGSEELYEVSKKFLAAGEEKKDD